MSPSQPIGERRSAASVASDRQRPGRRLLRWLAMAVLLLLAAGVAGTLYLTRDPMPRFAERRSALAHVEETAPEREDGHWVQTARLTATSGLQVDLAVKWPVDSGVAPEPRPLVVILGGHRTGRDAVSLVPETRGVIVAALSYPYAGSHRLKGMEVVRAVPAIRAALFDTPPAVQLALDHLLRRPDVDRTRVEGVGVSLGVPFMSIAAALDDRITRVWAIHGSGGIYTPLEHNLRKSVPAGPARAVVAAVATVAAGGSALAPEHWVSRIAPRPFHMISAEDDERLPRAAVEWLYANAGSPKEITWVPGGHVRSDPEVVRGLVDLVLQGVQGDTLVAGQAD